MTLTIQRGGLLPRDTQAQARIISQLETGLDYPAQGISAAINGITCPIWTDGDGGFYAIARNGELVDVSA